MWRILRVREGLEAVSQENGEVWSGLTPLKRGLSRKEQTKRGRWRARGIRGGAVVRKPCGAVRLRFRAGWVRGAKESLWGDREEQGTSRGGTQTDTYSHFQVLWL